jgi:cytochrome b subunit of formate dehydrogenase
MKRSRAYKNYPDWRQREMRMLIWAIAVGGVAAAITGIVVYYANHRGAF